MLKNMKVKKSLILGYGITIVISVALIILSLIHIYLGRSLSLRCGSGRCRRDRRGGGSLLRGGQLLLKCGFQRSVDAL